MSGIAGVDALGAVADVEVTPTSEAGRSLKDRHAYFLGGAWIQRRLVNNYGSGRKRAPHDFRGGNYGRQIGPSRRVNWGRHSNDVKVLFAQDVGIARKADLGVNSIRWWDFPRSVMAGTKV